MPRNEKIADPALDLVGEGINGDVGNGTWKKISDTENSRNRKQNALSAGGPFQGEPRRGRTAQSLRSTARTSRPRFTRLGGAGVGVGEN